MDNNHLLLLMIHVFRENEEQLFKVKTFFVLILFMKVVAFFEEKVNVCSKYLSNGSTVTFES